MKKIVIIGNSAAGIGAAEVIREKDPQAQIVIVSREPFLAYEPSRLPELLGGKMKEKQVYWRNQDFYKDKSIELYLECEVTGLNLSRKRIYFKEQEFLEFDSLLIATGRGVRLPSFKGIQKQGVVGFDCLAAAKEALDNLPVAHTVIIVGRSVLARDIARIIASRKIEVKFFGEFDQAPQGVDVLASGAIIEILGDREVKAVRLENQKVLGASLVIFADGFAPRIGFLEGTDIVCADGIIVDEAMRTNVPFVFAAGDVCGIAGKQKVFGWQNAYDEGRVAGGSLCQI